jgi:hypothetical protein
MRKCLFLLRYYQYFQFKTFRKAMGTIIVYPSSAAEAAEVRAYLASKHIRIEEAETDEEILEGLRESVQELNAVLRGQSRNKQSWEEMLNEVENERVAA